MEVLVDTDILISTLRKNPDKKCVDLLRQIEADKIDGYISALTVFELYYGANLSDNPKKNIRLVNELLSIFTVLDLTPNICKLSGKIGAELKKNGVGIDFRDLLIGATALHLNLVLVTSNVKHFSRIKGLKVKGPNEF